MGVTAAGTKLGLKAAQKTGLKAVESTADSSGDSDWKQHALFTGGGALLGGGLGAALYGKKGATWGALAGAGLGLGSSYAKNRAYTTTPKVQETKQPSAAAQFAQNRKRLFEEMTPEQRESYAQFRKDNPVLHDFQIAHYTQTGKFMDDDELNKINLQLAAASDMTGGLASGQMSYRMYNDIMSRKLNTKPYEQVATTGPVLNWAADKLPDGKVSDLAHSAADFATIPVNMMDNIILSPRTLAALVAGGNAQGMMKNWYYNQVREGKLEDTEENRNKYIHLGGNAAMIGGGAAGAVATHGGLKVGQKGVEYLGTKAVGTKLGLKATKLGLKAAQKLGLKAVGKTVASAGVPGLALAMDIPDFFVDPTTGEWSDPRKVMEERDRLQTERDFAESPNNFKEAVPGALQRGFSGYISPLPTIALAGKRIKDIGGQYVQNAAQQNVIKRKEEILRSPEYKRMLQEERAKGGSVGASVRAYNRYKASHKNVPDL